LKKAEAAKPAQRNAIAPKNNAGRKVPTGIKKI